MGLRGEREGEREREREREKVKPVILDKLLSKGEPSARQLLCSS